MFFAHAELIPGVVLENNSKTLMQAAQVVLAQVAPSSRIAPSVGRTGGQQLDERGLAGAVQAHQRDALSRRNKQVDILEDKRIRTRVLKGNIAEFDAFLD